MQATLADFFKALRGATLSPSLDAELDAARAVALVGWSDRERLKTALGATLAKSIAERDLFDAAFDRFFAFDAFASPEAGALPDDVADAAGVRDAAGRDAAGDAATPHGAPHQEPAQGEGGSGGAAGQGGQGAGSGGSAGSGGGGSARGEVDVGALAQLLLQGDQAALARRLLLAAREVGLSDIWLRTQRPWYTQRIAQAMGAVDLDRAIAAAQAHRGPAGERLRQARERLLREVAAFVDRQLALHAAAPTRALQEELLRAKPLSAIERRDLPRVRELVHKMARQLAARHARRQRRRRRGLLDVRRTMRRNAAYGGVLFDPVWRAEVLDRPRVVVVCDVSGSVAAHARFLLMFVHSLQALLSDLRSFAFVAELVEVSDLFTTLPLERAVDEVLRSVGGSGSHYGRMLEDFEARVLPHIDRRTTVLFLGDARSNHAPPRVDLLAALHRRARRVLWLNPEGRSAWGQGDSQMLRYAVHCDLAQPCRSLQELERALDHLLRARRANG